MKLKDISQIFAQTFAILNFDYSYPSHKVFLMFPKVYLENRKSKINIRLMKFSLVER